MPEGRDRLRYKFFQENIFNQKRRGGQSWNGTHGTKFGSDEMEECILPSSELSHLILSIAISHVSRTVL